MKPATLFLFLGGSAVVAQTAVPAFEVATIKPSAPLDPAAVRDGKAHTGTRFDAGRIDMGTVSLFRLICAAYRVKPYQVKGPDWMKTTMFDIQAKIPDGGTVEQIPEMMRELLVERFGLKTHRDSQVQPVYALVVAKGGPKMKKSVPDSPPPAADVSKQIGEANADSMSMPTPQGDVRITRNGQGISLEMPGGEISGRIRMTVIGGPGGPPRLHLESSGSMKAFAEMLSVGVVDRPVVDMTGLPGTYELAVDLSEEDAINVARASMILGPGAGGGTTGRPSDIAGASDPSGTSITTSIQKLGLKLEPRKLPLGLLVVDHIEKTPTGN